MQNTLKVYTDAIAETVKAALGSASEVVGDGEFEVLATSEAIDRDGDVVKMDGWMVDNFLKNPVVLWAHNYQLAPIGAITSINFSPAGMVVRGVFAKTELGQQIRQLYDDGIVRAMSVGFIAKERVGNVITKQELLEISFVPVPANAEALSLRRIQDVEATVTKMLGTKGQVTDVLNARAEMTDEDRLEKWENIDRVWSAVAAFSEVYSRPEVGEDQFVLLLGELVAILQGIASEEATEIVESGEIAKAMKTYKGTWKAGRVLSETNRTKIKAAMDTMLEAHGCLKELLDTTEPEKSAEASETDRLSGVERELALSAVRSVDKAVEHAIRLLKNNQAVV